MGKLNHGVLLRALLYSSFFIYLLKMHNERARWASLERECQSQDATTENALALVTHQLSFVQRWNSENIEFVSIDQTHNCLDLEYCLLQMPSESP